MNKDKFVAYTNVALFFLMGLLVLLFLIVVLGVGIKWIFEGG